jgi:hypothetical protein
MEAAPTNELKRRLLKVGLMVAGVSENVRGLPFVATSRTTPLEPRVVCERLRVAVEESRTEPGSWIEGSVGDADFTIVFRKQGQMPYLPVCEGTIAKEGSETRVSYVARPQWDELLILAAMLGCFSIFLGYRAVLILIPLHHIIGYSFGFLPSMRTLDRLLSEVARSQPKSEEGMRSR